MRLIGYLPSEKEASTFGNFLYSQDIANDVEPESDGRWAVWVHEEEKIPPSKELLDQFQQNPSASIYRESEKKAAELRSKSQKDLETHQRKIKDARQIFPDRKTFGVGMVTAVLIGVCALLFVLAQMGTNWNRFNVLKITEFDVTGNWMEKLTGLTEVKKGQVWRLFTPIFFHFGFPHVFFNLWGLTFLGSIVEARKGPVKLLGLVLVLALISNMAQYLLHGPAFGGISGVLYGLLGYVWIRGRLDPSSGFYIDKGSLIMMLGWLVVCWLKLIPNVANAAHIGGLVTGMLIGYLWAGRRA